jgi:hypothetical protein
MWKPWIKLPWIDQHWRVRVPFVEDVLLRRVVCCVIGSLERVRESLLLLTDRAVVALLHLVRVSKLIHAQRPRLETHDICDIVWHRDGGLSNARLLGLWFRGAATDEETGLNNEVGGMVACAPVETGWDSIVMEMTKAYPSKEPSTAMHTLDTPIEKKITSNSNVTPARRTCCHRTPFFQPRLLLKAKFCSTTTHSF